MKPGDRVVVLEDVLNYGIGVILWVEKTGRLVVGFRPPNDSPDWWPAHMESFDAFELELESDWMQAA